MGVGGGVESNAKDQTYWSQTLPTQLHPVPPAGFLKADLLCLDLLSWKGMETATTIGLNKLFVSKRESKTTVNIDCTFDLF